MDLNKKIELLTLRIRALEEALGKIPVIIPPPSGVGAGAEVAIGLTSEEIPGADGVTPGSGNGVICSLSDSTGEDCDELTIVPTVGSECFYNMCPNPVEAGNLVQLKKIRKWWFIDVVCCPEEEGDGSGDGSGA